uniref:Uncharacterized protein n=1 Tax=Acrobeloides nanus TaxID=290746 RepID=A0A914CLH1_9BILA
MSLRLVTSLLLLTIIHVVLISHAPGVEAFCLGDCIDIYSQGCSGFVGRGACGGGSNIQCCYLPRSGINKRNSLTIGH